MMVPGRFEDLPPALQKEEIRPYYEDLVKKNGQLLIKRAFDFLLALLLTLLVSPILLLAALAVKVSSKGPIFYRQERVTQFGRHFYILKFRTMVVNADQIGGSVTIDGDPRVTSVGHFLRRFRVDEFPQLLNILFGDMTLVGTRPEVPKFVRQYSDEMTATLLLPAGATSMCSIAFSHESDLIQGQKDSDHFYVETLLPQKMAINLSELKKFSLFHDLYVLGKTIGAIFQL